VVDKEKIKIEIELSNKEYTKLNILCQIFTKSLKKVLEKGCSDFINDTLNDIDSLL